MEKIKIKEENIQKMLKSLKRALDQLEKTTDEKQLEFIYDSVIARFKILVESTWKQIRLYLENQGFDDVPASPKGVIHMAKEVSFLTEEEYNELLKYLALRNLASHLYDQPQYVLVVDAVPGAYRLITTIIQRINSSFL